VTDFGSGGTREAVLASLPLREANEGGLPFLF